MKTPHSRSRFAFLRNAVAALAISLSVPGWAQQTAAPAAPEIPKEGQFKLAPEPPKGAQSTAAPKATSAFEAARSAMQTTLPEIDIPAGQHLRGVVELLSDKTGANIVLDESLNGLKLPALKLRNVTVTSVLDTIRAISKEGISVSYSEDRGGSPGALVAIVSPSRRGEIRKPTKICRVFRLTDPVSNAWNLTRSTPKPRPADKTEEEKEAIVEEYAKKALTEIIDRISEATRQACQALDRANGRKRESVDDYPQIDANIATRLLIVTGDEADVDLTGQIISGVGGTPMESAKPELPRRNQDQNPSIRR